MGIKDGDLARCVNGEITEYDDNGGLMFVDLIDYIERSRDVEVAAHYLRRAEDLLAREWKERQAFVSGAIADLKRYGNGGDGL